jgi:hypothetical protein
LTIKPIMSGRYLTGFTPVLSKREGDREIPSYSFVLKTPFPPGDIIELHKDLIQQVWEGTQDEMDGIRKENLHKQQSEHSGDDSSTGSGGSGSDDDSSDDDSGSETSNDGGSGDTPMTSPEIGSSGWGANRTVLSEQSV